MLTRLSIEGFKTFDQRTDLSLAAVNVLAGANSSGKSSILQTLLLLKQTAQHPQPGRSMVLNGPITKLGSFKDVANSSSSADTFAFGLRFDHIDNTQAGLIRPPGNASSQTDHTADFSSFSYEFTWGQSPHMTGTRRLHARLASATLEVEHAVEEEDSDRNPSTIAVRLNVSSGDGEEDTGEEGATPLYDVILDQQSSDDLVDRKPMSNIIGCQLRNFLPDQIAILYNLRQRRAKELSAYLTGQQGILLRSMLTPSVLTPNVINTVNAWIKRHSLTTYLLREDLPTLPYTEIRNHISHLRYQIRRTLRIVTEYTIEQRASELSGIIEASLQESSPGDTGFTVDFDIPDDILHAATYLRNFLLSNVRYLGPLRDEPKPIYPFEALAHETDVGIRGEHTAAVFDLYKHSMVTYIPPSEITDDYSVENQRTRTLHDACVDWLIYLGVATELKTEERDVFGHQIRVQLEADAPAQDLTNVGVGVSQVLPIVVSALLAPQGSMLLFEQPGLHLHPKVQTRLGDFFLSVSLMGRQCILETHSEYMVDRFRLRIAESLSADFKDIFSIYFTQKFAGTTQCRSVELNEYGAIADWPEDFFDQSSKQVSRILHAAKIKRARNVKR